MTNEIKLTTPRFAVNYWNDDGTFRNSDMVVAMPFMGKDEEPNLKDLIALQEELLRYSVFKTAAIGSLVCDAEGLDLINRIAKMLVVVGKPKRGIDLYNLLNVGDYVQLGQIFMSRNYSLEGVVPTNYQPSKIAEIHKMDFLGKLNKLNKELETGIIEELIKEQPEPARPVVEEIPLIKPEPISTPPPVAVPAKSTSSPI